MINVDLDAIARRSRRNGPWERRRYWLPEGWTAPLDAPRASHTQTDDQIARARARAAAKRARKNARRLALRDLDRLRSMQDAIARAEAMLRSAGVAL